jgi:hypothetical protein
MRSIPDGGYSRTPPPPPPPANHTSTSSDAGNRAEAPAVNSVGGNDIAKPAAVPMPQRVADAPSNAPGANGQSQKPPLANAAINTQIKVGDAANANQTLENLQKLPPSRRNAIRAEIDIARRDATQADSQARTAIAEELDIAQTDLSPAHYGRYVEGMERDFTHDSAQQALVRSALANAPQSVQYVASPNPTDPALADIKDQAKAVGEAETRYATVVEESKNLPPHIQSLTTSGAKADLDQKRAKLDQMIADDLTAAATQKPTSPYAAPLEDRARMIAALDPANKTLQATVTETTRQIATERVTTPAVDSVNRTYTEKGAVAAAEELATRAAQMTPEQSARMVERLDGTIEQIATDLGKSRNQDDVNKGVAGLARAAEKAGPEATQQIAESLITGFDDAGVVVGGSRAGAVRDYKLDNALQAAIGDGAGANLAVATSDALTAAGRADAANKIDEATVSGVEELRKDFDATQESYAKLEAELNADLAQFGPGLTQEQRTAYVEAFWADSTRPTDEKHKDDLSHAEVKAKFESIDEQLSSTLAVAGPRMEEMARAGNEHAGEKLLDAYETLARTPQHAQESIEWMNRVKGDSALFGKIDGFINDDLNKRFEEKISSDGVQSMASKLLADMANASDPKAAEKIYNTFKETLSNIGLSRTAKDTITDVFTKVDKIRADINALKKLDRSDVNYDKIVKRLESNTKSLVDGFGEKGKFAKSLAVVGVAVGLADSYLAFKDGNMPEGIKSAISASADAAEVGIGVLGILQKAGKVSGEVAEGAGKFGAKLLPVIGLGLDLVQGADDIKQLLSNPNAGEVIAGIGTALNLASDVVEFVPIAGTALGAVIGGVGSLLHGIGGFVDNLIEGDQAKDALNDRQRAYLDKAGLDKPTADNYVKTGYALSFYENFDMSPEAVRNLVNREASLDGDQSNLTRVAMETAAAFGLKGERAEKFFDSVYNSPNAQKLMNDPYADYSSTQRDPNFLGRVTGDNADDRDYLMHELRTDQAEWFKENMPDVYDQYFATPPGLPSYADPVENSIPTISFFEDFNAIVTGNDGIAGR